MKKYWKGLDELNNTPEFIKSAEQEFPEQSKIEEFLGNDSLADTSHGRRDFLKFLGFGVTAATLAACETPVTKTIPYLIKPEEITPGIANWYASTYFDGSEFASIMVKTREGRPIKIEGNKLSPITKGGTNARINSSVLSLYDNARLTGPTANGSASTWETVDKEIKEKLTAIAAKNGNIRILSSTVISPSTKAVIVDFAAKHKNVKHVTYDALSFAGMLKANEESFGKAVIPSYHFNKAKVIVSFDADFLVNWLSSVEYAGQYAETRNPKNKEMSRLHVFEANLSLTGSNADVRVALKPSQSGLAVLSLYNYLAAKAGASAVGSEKTDVDAKIAKTAEELWANKGNALVVSGSNDTAIQTVVNAINSLLGSYGTTIDLDTPYYIKQGNDAEVFELVKEMNEGKVDALFLYNTNPAYTLPNAKQFAEGLKKTGLTVSFADRADETASLVQYICPDHHYLESWNDANPRKGYYGLTQPTIAPLFKTRAAQESLLKWADNNETYHDFIKKHWDKNMFPLQSKELFFESFWNMSLHDGIFSPQLSESFKLSESSPASAFKGNVGEAANVIKKGATTSGDYELVIYVKTGIGEGNQANNPWLQELPDPISKITWDNYITMSPAEMEDPKWNFSRLERGDNSADVVELTVNGMTVKLPVIPQPGQKKGTLGIALGYGRTKAGKTANGVGVNAYPFTSLVNGTIQYCAIGAKIAKTTEKYPIGSTQTHHTMMGREIVKETTLDEYIKNPKSGNKEFTVTTTNHGKQRPNKVNLWADHPIDKGLRWGLVIDLNSCIGCGACVTSCSSENNVPVVGKDEVRRSREMHWIRIDRYYSSDMNDEKAKEEKKGTVAMFTEMEKPSSENPQVVFQPVMCQHCNHAPCETVCPVAATTHSMEGLNQMAYNRCIGTRYCANNCPYKVRRFNWFKYSDNNQFDFNMNNDLGKMVLNPDVVVRSRGVMEKCSLCVQNIQAGKLKAKKEGKTIKDGDITTACASACPTNAIVFGDLNDENSMITKQSKDERSYHLLEEVGTQTNVHYLTKVRNVEGEKV